jgi:hypothetical protein
MDAEGDHPESEDLIPRAPSVEDLVELCRELNRLEASYLVIGGFAIRAAGYVRNTMDVDLLILATQENEARVLQALRILPDQAVKELESGDVAKYQVVRVADEIIVDLMKSACGIEYEEASREIEIREVDGVPIPFASPRLLWRMKAPIRREKDMGDLVFLREYFEGRGETPPPPD